MRPNRARNALWGRLIERIPASRLRWLQQEFFPSGQGGALSCTPDLSVVSGSSAIPAALRGAARAKRAGNVLKSTVDFPSDPGCRAGIASKQAGRLR